VACQKQLKHLACLALEIENKNSEQLEKVWFTDASARHEGKVWKYRAVASQIRTEEKNHNRRRR